MLARKTLGYHRAQREDNPPRLPGGALAKGRLSERGYWTYVHGPRSG